MKYKVYTKYGDQNSQNYFSEHHNTTKVVEVWKITELKILLWFYTVIRNNKWSDKVKIKIDNTAFVAAKGKCSRRYGHLCRMKRKIDDKMDNEMGFLRKIQKGMPVNNI